MLVVDDSVVIRRLVTQALSQHPAIEVVGVAANGTLSLQRIAQFTPDVITLDIEMPEMNGLETLRHIRRDYPSTRVIMFSSLTERGASITLEALTMGADDYLPKSATYFSGDTPTARLQQVLIPKITQFFNFSEHGAQDGSQSEPARAPSISPRKRVLTGAAPKVVVIGVSTGGPTALNEILPSFPSDFPLPILIVQHMPPLFTRLLGERLNANCVLHVEEAKQGTIVEPGRILIAPGDYHMAVAPTTEGVGVILDQSAQQNFCRPAVDVLFRSAAEVYGASVLAVVLTGMGQDGLRGAETLRACGATVFAQDEETSIVWGMPGAVVSAGLADRVLPIQEIAPEVIRASARVGGIN